MAQTLSISGFVCSQMLRVEVSAPTVHRWNDWKKIYWALYVCPSSPPSPNGYRSEVIRWFKQVDWMKCATISSHDFESIDIFYLFTYHTQHVCWTSPPQKLWWPFGVLRGPFLGGPRLTLLLFLPVHSATCWVEASLSDKIFSLRNLDVLHFYAVDRVQILTRSGTSLSW